MKQETLNIIAISKGISKYCKNTTSKIQAIKSYISHTYMTEEKYITEDDIFSCINGAKRDYLQNCDNIDNFESRLEFEIKSSMLFPIPKGETFYMFYVKVIMRTFCVQAVKKENEFVNGFDENFLKLVEGENYER